MLGLSKNVEGKCWLTRQLSNPETYSAAIKKYADKLHKKSVYNLENELGEFEVSWLLRDRDKIAGIIASLFKTRQLDFAALSHQIIYVNNKQRSIYTCKTLENIVESAILSTLLPKLKEYSAPGLQSYLPGCNLLKTVRSLSFFLKKTQGEILVLKTDIVKYFESIPVHDSSALWKMLDDFLLWLDPENKIDPYTYSLIRSRINASYINSDGSLSKKHIGTLIGRHTSIMVGILYLRELDIAMSNLKNGLYLRYSDDILWMSNNINDFEQGELIINNKLMELGLSRNLQKDLYATLTKSGANYIDLARFNGISKLEYLGYAVSRCGQISLPLKDIRKVKKILEDKIKNLNRTLDYIHNVEQRIKLVVLAINQFLNPVDKLEKGIWGRKIIDHRSFLKELDFFIAIRIIMICTNNYNLCILKKYNYKWLKKECGLISLCNLANVI